MFYFVGIFLFCHFAYRGNVHAQEAAATQDWRLDDLVQLFSNDTVRNKAIGSLLGDVTRKATGELDRLYRQLEGVASQLGGGVVAQLEPRAVNDQCSCYCRCPRDTVATADKLVAIKMKMADVKRRFSNDSSPGADSNDVQNQAFGNSDNDAKYYNLKVNSNIGDENDANVDQNEQFYSVFNKYGRMKRATGGGRNESAEIAKEQSNLKSQLRELNSLSDKVDVHVKKIKKSIEHIGQNLKHALTHSTKLFNNVLKYGSKLKNKTLSVIKK